MTHPDGMQIRITRQEIGRIVGCSREMVDLLTENIEALVAIREKFSDNVSYNLSYRSMKKADLKIEGCFFYFSYGHLENQRLKKEFSQLIPREFSPHKSFTHQESIYLLRTHRRNILTNDNTTFGNHHTIRRNLIQQSIGIF
jgi:hypothetical protein